MALILDQNLDQPKLALRIMTELVTGDYSAEDGKSLKEEMDAENL